MDIASLGFRIDTGDVAKAETALDSLNATGAKTEATAKGVGAAWTEAGRKVGAGSSPLGSVASAVKQGSDAMKAQQGELAKLLGKIDPVTAALDRLDDQEKQLGKFKAGGLLDAETFAEYRAKVDQARNGLSDIDGVLRRAGTTSKQTSAALRMLPAQFSDIAISLQAGQSPLSVFLQQGSQIKDSFGGVGPALRETAKYALGLINPFTVAAAAAAGLAYAYFEGSKESERFNKSLILTGGYAGMTASQLASLSDEMDSLAGVTQGSAAEALNQVAASGQFAGEQIKLVAVAAEQMRVATGKSVEDTIAEFVKLRRDPVSAILELNDKYHFLERSQLDQIRTLKEQGKEQEAATEAMRVYAGVVAERTPQIEQNLGSIERSWNAIKKAASETVDGLKGIGRVSSEAERVVTLTQKIAYLKSTLGTGFEPLADTAGEVAKLAAELDGLTKKQKEAAFAPTVTVDTKAETERMKAREEFDRLAISNLAKEAKLEREILDIQKLGLKAGVQQSDIDMQVVAARARYAESLPKSRKPEAAKVFADDAATKMLQSLREQGATLESQLKTTEKLSVAERTQIEFAQQIADLKEKSILTADQKSLLANEGIITAQLAQNVALDEQIQKRHELAKSAEEAARKQDLVNREAKGVIDSLKTEEERIKESYERRRQSILDSSIATAEEKNEALLRLEEQNTEDMIKVNGSYWERYLLAAEDSLGNFDELAASTVENFSTRFGDAFESMIFDAQTLEEAVSGMAEGMARAVVNALGQMAAQWLAYQIVQMLVGKTTKASAAASMIAIAEATSAQAGLAAFASTAAIPIVGPAAAPAAAATAVGLTLPMVAAVSAGALAGMAHDGIDSVPREGTWLLDKGERVVDSRTNADLKRYLAAPDQSAQAGQAPPVNINITMPGLKDAPGVREATGGMAKKVGGAVSRARRYS
ncbi:hypothetical protein D3879_14600 [Pseudomonas cavernicola]|uniref:Bacteriophage tail tape measure N-terminal domain-containing protein n=1 Tax=Pseudomonas cavernicola TaxID=2320866 RepID=A0A418XEY9_9PSED|nr:phage tail length tape measure family protein [Pseudomonas cavernicola]RJG10908.1 hypothetical protein D3879_14600 [Pseudomonas cavernicola]